LPLLAVHYKIISRQNSIMDSNVIPSDIERFLLKHIDSIAQLEALLLLRSDPQSSWGTEALAKRLYISEKQTAEIVSELCTGGFLIVKTNKPRRYQYQPNSVELGNIIERVAETYSKHLVAVTDLIHSKSKNRVQKFADAFRLRKDE
jgi:hypothetical protein